MPIRTSTPIKARRRIELIRLGIKNAIVIDHVNHFVTQHNQSKQGWGRKERKKKRAEKKKKAKKKEKEWRGRILRRYWPII
jgi:hypothetical protein